MIKLISLHKEEITIDSLSDYYNNVDNFKEYLDILIIKILILI
jgi:hypothetical protein